MHSKRKASTTSFIAIRRVGWCRLRAAGTRYSLRPRLIQVGSYGSGRCTMLQPPWDPRISRFLRGSFHVHISCIEEVLGGYNPWIALLSVASVGPGFRFSSQVRVAHGYPRLLSFHATLAVYITTIDRFYFRASYQKTTLGRCHPITLFSASGRAIPPRTLAYVYSLSRL
jgi:hypothetical protein